ncbi:hypothetical protein [uncultured Chryseobacterium sp.]|uniref:hypothetical protein n=1 Tax=uncultured Chryseobacterium sp. TaxID=259322 RepID=UPI0025F908B3|nr:hypothetical protein [uncultured Chryseobacterium sp.]
MKKINLSFTIMLLSYQLYCSQVGINTSNPQGRFHVDGNKDNPATGSPNSTQAANDFFIDPVGNTGVGTLIPSVKLDLRSAGSNNSLGIGNTAQTAAQVSAGTLRYVPVNGGVLQYSDGTAWFQLKTPDIEKTNVVARIRSAAFQPQYQFPYNIDKKVTQFEEFSDNKNAFDPSSGEFIAPRNGIYLLTFSYDMVKYWVLKGGMIEVDFVKTTDSGAISIEKKCVRSLASYGDNSSVTYARQSQVGGSCVGAISLNTNEKIYATIRQTTYNGDLSLRLPPSGAVNDLSNTEQGFNHLTITEQ